MILLLMILPIHAGLDRCHPMVGQPALKRPRERPTNHDIDSGKIITGKIITNNAVHCSVRWDRRRGLHILNIELPMDEAPNTPSLFSI